MPRRKKHCPEPDFADGLKLIELQLAVIGHCRALKAVTVFLAEGKTEAAVARLDQTTAALHAIVRGQAVGQTMNCPRCDTPQDIVAWVDDRICNQCGGELEPPKILE